LDAAWLGIAEAGRLFRSRALSPVDMVRALLERIGGVDRRVHAFIRTTPETALDEARRAEADFASGRIRGPLHGIAYALKDNIDVAGLPTTCNSKILADNVARADAAVVRRMREAGAILLGKTTLHEFATGGAMFDLPWPAARNPWNLALHPGGSSSGSGAAVAAGLVPAAIGTDTGGSVRHPATVCGIVGMKPTFDLVSCEGVFPYSASLDHVGPLTRDVEDNALLLEAMSGRAGAYSSRLRAGVAGLRIGVIEEFHAGKDPDADHLRNFERAAAALGTLGARVAPVQLPPLEAWRECGRTIQEAEGYLVFAKWLAERPQDFSAFARERLSRGKGMPAAKLAAARAKRLELQQRLAAVLREHDALIALSSLAPPSAMEPAAVAATYTRQARMPFNVSGTPALSVPTGFSGDGLPTGMQVAGKAGDEATMYRVAWACYEQAGCAGRRPTL